MKRLLLALPLALAPACGITPSDVSEVAEYSLAAIYGERIADRLSDYVSADPTMEDPEAALEEILLLMASMDGDGEQDLDFFAFVLDMHDSYVQADTDMVDADRARALRESARLRALIEEASQDSE